MIDDAYVSTIVSTTRDDNLFLGGGVPSSFPLPPGLISPKYNYDSNSSK